MASKKTKKPAKRPGIRHRQVANRLLNLIPLEATRGNRVSLVESFSQELLAFEERGRISERKKQALKNKLWSESAQRLYAYLHSTGQVKGVALFNTELRPLMAEPAVLATWTPKQANHLKLRERATNLLRKMPAHAPEGSRSWEGAIADVIEALQGSDQ